MPKNSSECPKGQWKIKYIYGMSSTLLYGYSDQYSTKRQLIHNELNITYWLEYTTKTIFGCCKTNAFLVQRYSKMRKGVIEFERIFSEMGLFGISLGAHIIFINRHNQVP